MPGRKHLPGATAKQQRQYEHIKQAERAAGRSLKRAKQIAAATVRKLAKQVKRGAKKVKRRISRDARPSFAQQLAREVEQSLTAGERARLREMGFRA